jgi:hypothetical protein
MMSRRQLLLGGLGTAALAALGLGTFGRGAIEAEIAAHVRRRLSFLTLDDTGLRRFAADQVAVLLAKRPTVNRLKYHFLSHIAPSFTRYLRSTETRSRLEQTIDAFASTYLMSSDFFQNGADESETVHYVSFYDPLLACGNPFARAAIDRTATA